MGIIGAQALQQIGDCILKYMREHGELRYRCNLPDKEFTLRYVLGVDDDRSFPADWINWAVVILEEWLIIEWSHDIGPHPAEFSVLKPTEKGGEFIAAGREFKYWDLEE